jgi:biotin-dependent carboxylase-like uncharacterized protein
VNAIRILRPGLFTTVQDLGRYGFQHLGVPVSGAMDVASHRLANALVGNAPADASLECTVIGPALEVRGRARMAVAGAECTISVDGARHEPPCVFDVADGTRIEIGAATRGARMYLAVQGGFDAPPVLGSRSTDARSGLGAFGGRRLAAGDEVAIGIPCGDREPLPATAGRRSPWLPRPGTETRLRAIPGAHANDALPFLTASTLTVSSQCDRVGYRFDERLQARGAADLLSMPIAFGTIQLTPSGEVILLMADRQTVGGYAQVATLAAADQGVAGQLAPGCRVRFVECSPDEAARALQEDDPFFGDTDR